MRKLLERLLTDRNTLQDDLEAALSLVAARLAKKYGWNREVVGRFLEQQLYVAVLRFQTRHMPERSMLEFEKALETVALENAMQAQKDAVVPVTPVKKVKRRIRRAA